MLSVTHNLREKKMQESLNWIISFTYSLYPSPNSLFLLISFSLLHLYILKVDVILIFFFNVCLVRGFWRGWDGKRDDILNFYVWFNFLTWGGEGMREVIYFFTLTKIWGCKCKDVDICVWCSKNCKVVATIITNNQILPF
jgi:hypothetical protein